MLKLKKALALTLGLTLTATAVADETFIASVSDGSEDVYVLDGRTRSLPGNIKEVWRRRVIIKDVEKDGLDVGGYSLEKWQYDCDGYRVKLLAWYDYRSSGKLVNSYSDPYPTWQDLPPDTVGEGILEYVCR